MMAPLPSKDADPVRYILPFFLLASSCTPSEPEKEPTPTSTNDTATTQPVVGDEDGDGVSEEDGDCNDSDAAVFPGAKETCDGADNDCDGLTDELPDAATLDGSENFSTLQEAIDAAESGASIVVCDGIWGGPITIHTPLNLSSVGGQYDCILDGQSEDSTVTVTASDVTITGMTITGGLAAMGGGINGVSADRLEVEQSIITLNTADFGGGIYLGEGGEVNSTVITQNNALSYGGGIAAKVDASVQIINATIEDNSAQLGGGAFLYEGASMTVLGISTLSDNAADSGGGAYVWAGSLTGGQMEGNDAIYGGGLYFYDGGEASDVLLYGNTAHYGGGAMVHGVVSLDDTLLTLNNASMAGGGLSIEEGSVFCIGTTRIEDNTTDEDGGGVALDDGGLFDCEVLDNEAADSAGGIFASGDFELSGVVVDGNDSDVRAGGLYANGPIVGTITDSEITSNSATSWGGGVYANNGASVAIESTLISENLSDFGAGLYIHQGSSLAISNSWVEENGNNATTTGGGARIGDGDLISTQTDWGVAAQDNTPDDVVAGQTGEAYVGYEASETFTCDALACSPTP
jgi:hypothetical protein